MKKEQKIIELRTAAKLNIAEIKTKIAVARSEAASERARLMRERAYELKGLDAGCTERFDVLAKYIARLAGVEEKLSAMVAQLKAEIMQTKSECEQQCAAAEDEYEDDPETMKKLPQQPVYCDGSEHSARIVARRLINKMPHIQKGGYMFVHVLKNEDGECFVSVTESSGTNDKYVSEIFQKEYHSEEFEAEFMEKARRIFAEEQESGNGHVAEPMARALDDVFGCNPVEESDNLISVTVKDGKEGGNE